MCCWGGGVWRGWGCGRCRWGVGGGCCGGWGVRGCEAGLVVCLPRLSLPSRSPRSCSRSCPAPALLPSRSCPAPVLLLPRLRPVPGPASRLLSRPRLPSRPSLPFSSSVSALLLLAPGPPSLPLFCLGVWLVAGCGGWCEVGHWCGSRTRGVRGWGVVWAGVGAAHVSYVRFWLVRHGFGVGAGVALPMAVSHCAGNGSRASAGLSFRLLVPAGGFSAVYGFCGEGDRKA